jgi:hypothetical protein
MKMERDKNTFGRSITISYSKSELEKDLGYRLSQVEKRIGRLEAMIERAIRLMEMSPADPKCGSCKFCKPYDEKIHSVWICNHPGNQVSESNIYVEINPLQAACDKYERFQAAGGD